MCVFLAHKRKRLQFTKLQNENKKLREQICLLEQNEIDRFE